MTVGNILTLSATNTTTQCISIYTTPYTPWYKCSMFTMHATRIREGIQDKQTYKAVRCRFQEGRRPNKCITTGFLEAGAVLLLDLPRPLAEQRGKVDTMYRRTLQTFRAEHQQTSREFITINTQLATRAAGREHAAHAKLLNHSLPYLLLRRLAGKRGCFSSSPAFRWRRVRSAAKSQGAFHWRHSLPPRAFPRA